MPNNRLYPYNIDLHYHAGQERQVGTTLAGYLEHATFTGRVMVGLTDHLEFYIGNPLTPPRPEFTYEQSVRGLLNYREDVDRERQRFPNLCILFGPEIHAGNRIDLRSIPPEVTEVADYFHCSLPFSETHIETNTEARIQRIRDVADLRERSGKPAFICHPFRESVNWRLVKNPVPAWVTTLQPRQAADFAEQDLGRFFGFDVRALAQACRACALPIEINGGTNDRIRSLNLPAPLQMLWASYRIFRDEGVTFVPGSDQHAYMRGSTRREGRYVPFDAFDWLGVTVADMPFVRNLFEGTLPAR